MDQTNAYQTLNLKGRMFTCPVGGKRTTFQLVNEMGVGEAYAGLIYELQILKDLNIPAHWTVPAQVR